MFNRQCYMHTNDAYFAPSMIWFPYELKKKFEWILYKLQYLHAVSAASTSLYIAFGSVG